MKKVNKNENKTKNNFRKQSTPNNKTKIKKIKSINKEKQHYNLSLLNSEKKTNLLI